MRAGNDREGSFVESRRNNPPVLTITEFTDMEGYPQYKSVFSFNTLNPSETFLDTLLSNLFGVPLAVYIQSEPGGSLLGRL